MTDALDEERITEILTDGLPGATTEFRDAAPLEYAGATAARCCTLKFPGGRASIIFVPERKEIYLGSIGVSAKDKFQKQGISKKLLGNLSLVASEMDIPSIRLVATKVGSYVWARAGFVQEDSGHTTLGKVKQALRGRLNALDIPTEEKASLDQLIRAGDARCLWDIADSAHGFELLYDLRYIARLDVRDPVAMARFSAYTALSRDQEKAIAERLQHEAEAMR